MKSVFSLAGVVAVGFVALCGAKSAEPGTSSASVESVKGGVLKLDKSTTLGQAFDGYRYFSATVWTPNTTETGRKLVEAAGTINFAKLTAKDYALGMARAIGVSPEMAGGDADTMNQYAASLRNVQKGFKGAQMVFQFVLNLDDTFTLKGCTMNLVLTDNRVVPTLLSDEQASVALKEIYEGQLPTQVMAVLLLGIGGDSSPPAPKR